MPSVILYGLFFFLHYGCWMKTNRGKMKINEKWMKLKSQPLILEIGNLNALWVEGGTRTHDIQNHNLTL